MSAGLIYGCVAPHPPILVPAVAGPRIEQVRQTREAMQRVASEIRRLSPDTVVLVSPHAPISPRAMSVSVAQWYTGSFEDFGAPSVRLSFEGDTDLASALEAQCQAARVPTGRMGRPGGGYLLDHGAAVPLYFLQEAGLRCRLLLLAFSSLDTAYHSRFGRAIAAAARDTGGRVVLVASGDFSHRLSPGAPAGYSPLGRQFDQIVVSALRRGDRESILTVDQTVLYEAGECGYRSLVIALGALPEAEVEVLSYEGPFGVGYLVARFSIGSLEVTSATPSPEAGRVEGVEAEEREVLRLARSTVESYVSKGVVPASPPRPEGLLAGRAGVFVSLKIEGDLRGCIGTFLPTEPNIAAEIVRNAVAAAARDPRFLPVTPEELPSLHYSVDVLSPPEPVADMGQLDSKRYGVIVQSGAKRGLLLPDLEGVPTAAIQVDIARRKAGIPEGAPMQLYRFTVRRIREAGET